ncbi:hypothetical protein [Kineosporia sp. NBRC 101731]|uniref:hypothetical protein n=1 Tax=Kineosporia sp. NBRC 101731 TaxID=3032199 RepID=UPI0024A3CC34|nr:hypothetical protein [Kineosporia sp. NBRC 101731]GLY33556.1 cell division protein FtsK [Kineosporia sp. NBRC 101731]
MSTAPAYGTPEPDDHDASTRNADVVDLAAARARNTTPDTRPDSVPDTRPDTSPDTEPDTAPDTDPPIEGTIVAPGTGPDAVLVDSPQAQRRAGWSLAGMREAERRPVVPTWLRSRTEFTANTAWAAGLAGHTLAYHCVRVPKYSARLAFRAPRGAARLVSRYSRWWFDMEGEPVRQSIVRAATTRPDEARTYERLSSQRDRRVRWRSIVTAMVAGLSLATLIAAFLVPAWLLWSTIAVAVILLGIIGAPADRPLLDTAVIRTEVTPLTSDQVVEALSRLRIVDIDRAMAKGDTGRGWFAAPITRENGAGWRADITLPPGALAAEVVEKREKLAAALARPLGCVWPEVNADVHPGRLVLFVADRDMSKSRQAAWPLLKAGKVDLFEPFTIGTDPRGQVVALTLMFASMIIGSVPRMGKTFTLRLILLAACLDPRAKVLAFDLKGTGDLSATEPVAHRYRAGDEDEDIAYGLAAMRELRTELRRRTKVIRDLPRDICPENKVTPDLADRKSLGLEPIVAGVDECQVWFEHSQYGGEFEEICVDLIKRGPAAGISLILATQRPDAKSIPPGISANAVLRFCLKVMGWRENDMVLGDSMHAAGIAATMFSRRDRGIGYLAGEGDDPVIARTHYIDGVAAEQVVARARAMREKAGTLTGYALGQNLNTDAIRRDTLLDDIALILTDSAPNAWSEVVAERLTELRPEVYPTLTKEQLTAALKPYGVVTRQVWGTDADTGEGANRRGLKRPDILKAITKRDRDKQ